MTGTIISVEPLATRSPEDRTGRISGPDGEYTFRVADLVGAPEIVDDAVVGRSVTFNRVGQSDARDVRLT
jgi:hypothetical protein